MTALEPFLIACVIVMIALAAYFFLQTRKAIAERERAHNAFMERKRAFERNMADFESKPRRDNRGTSARGLIGGAQGSSAGGAAGPSGSVLPQGAGSNSVDYSNPMASLLRDDFDYTPERCDSSSFSGSSYSCESGSSSDSGSSGGGE